MPERKMKQYQSKIDELPGHLMAQELALGLRKRQRVIPPFLMGLSRRIHAAVFSFMAGVIPPIAMLGRSLLYVQSHFVA